MPTPRVKPPPGPPGLTPDQAAALALLRTGLLVSVGSGGAVAVGADRLVDIKAVKQLVALGLAEVSPVYCYQAATGAGLRRPADPRPPDFFRVGEPADG